jgi:hypothetical protein
MDQVEIARDPLEAAGKNQVFIQIAEVLHQTRNAANRPNGQWGKERFWMNQRARVTSGNECVQEPTRVTLHGLLLVRTIVAYQENAETLRLNSGHEQIGPIVKPTDEVLEANTLSRKNLSATNCKASPHVIRSWREETSCGHRFKASSRNPDLIVSIVIGTGQSRHRLSVLVD